MKPINKLYMWCIKKLLGVRKTTRNDLCLLESGYPPLVSLVKAKQRKFFRKMWIERHDMPDDPLIYVLNQCMYNNTSTSRLLHDFVNNDVDDVEKAFEDLKASVILMESPKAQLYRALNPQMSVHPVYAARPGVNELERISWSRLRLSAHSLAIEQGRWNRRGRGRLPIEERICICGEVQTEAHVFESCPR